MNEYKYVNWMQMKELVLDDSLMQITGMAETSFFVSFCVSFNINPLFYQI